MPEFVLEIKADLENIEKLVPIDGNLWKFDVESLSGELREGITFSASEELQIQGSRGTAHFIMKFSGEMDAATIKVVSIKKNDGTYSASGRFTKVLALECRNVIPTRWIPGEDFAAISSAGKNFPLIDLSGGSWADYDEDNDLPVSVMDLEHKITRA